MIEVKAYAGRDNSFTLGILRGIDKENANVFPVATVTKWELVLRGDERLADQSMFVPKPEQNTIEVRAGIFMNDSHLGIHKAHLVGYTFENEKGIRFPDFRLRVG